METLLGAVMVFCISVVLFYAVLQIANYHKMKKDREAQKMARIKDQNAQVVAAIKARRDELDQLRRDDPQEYERIKQQHRANRTSRSASRRRSVSSRNRKRGDDNSMAMMNTATYSATSSSTFL